MTRRSVCALATLAHRYQVKQKSGAEAAMPQPPFVAVVGEVVGFVGVVGGHARVRLDVFGAVLFYRSRRIGRLIWRR